jgi:hypothetical protein
MTDTNKTTPVKEKNPLQQFFRQPAIYITLPSKGKFYPEGTLDMPPNNELPIYPMTAIDEMTNRTPDALFNGSAMSAMISSCVPNIKDPWEMPQCDIDIILTAIKLASYGHSLEMQSTCQECAEVQDSGIDLRIIIDSFKPVDYSETLNIGDLTFHLKPLSYKQVNENAMFQFQEQKTLSVADKADLPDDEKSKLMTDALHTLSRLTVLSISKSISLIHSPQGSVTNYEQIKEYIEQCDRGRFERIKDFVFNQKNASEAPGVDLTCKSCEHKYQQRFTLDITNFFE